MAAFNVDPSGSLTPVAGSPFTVNDDPYGLAMSPDGKRLFVAGSVSDDLASYPVSADGALGAATSTAPAGSGAASAAVSPDSRFVYSGAFGAPTGFGFSVAGDTGALTPLAGSPYLPGASDAQGVATTPNQGPKANLKVIPQAPGVKEKVQFKGDASTDSDGSIVSYVYDFGDGTTKTGTAEKPKVSHKYKQTGTFTVTLTVTDNEGCSTAVVYTGQTASCNGSARRGRHEGDHGHRQGDRQAEAQGQGEAEAERQERPDRGQGRAPRRPSRSSAPARSRSRARESRRSSR